MKNRPEKSEAKFDKVMSDVFGVYFNGNHRYFWGRSYAHKFSIKLKKYTPSERGTVQFYFQFIHKN